MNGSVREYLPAAGRDLLLPLYDPLTKLLGIGRAWRALIGQAQLRPGHRVLEIGCGTGGLLLVAAREHPDVELVGLDPDPKALARAGRKARRSRLALQLDRGFADALPYSDASFDRVLSSFMFHHLEPDDKISALREVNRVLSPGGRLELMDFAGHVHPGLVHKWLHARFHHRLADNAEDRILGMLAEAGFVASHVVAHGRSLVGRFARYQAQAPDLAA